MCRKYAAFGSAWPTRHELRVEGSFVSEMSGHVVGAVGRLVGREIGLLSCRAKLTRDSKDVGIRFDAGEDCQRLGDSATAFPPQQNFGKVFRELAPAGKRKQLRGEHIGQELCDLLREMPMLAIRAT
jgi:hypothetical protein